MISVKINNKFSIILMGLLISVSCLAKNTNHNCASVGKNKVCLLEYIDHYGENAYRLKIENTEYNKISYYNNAKLKKINEENIEISTNFSDRGNVDISIFILLKNNKPFLKTISSSSRINEPPFGAIQNCKVTINQYLSKDIDFYIENYIFDLSENEKSKICKMVKLTN